MAKYFVLDTNVLLHNSAAVNAFADNVVVLPMTVLEELDRFKGRNDELGRNARGVIRHLDSLRVRGRLRDGVPLDSGGTLQVFFQEVSTCDMGLDTHVPDNQILAVAYILHQQGKKVIFVSKDINARLKADAIGLDVMDFEKQKVNTDDLFTGFKTLTVAGEIIDAFYNQESLHLDDESLIINEFVVLQDEANPKHSGLAKVGEDRGLWHLTKHSEAVWNIRTRSKEQRMALELLMDPAVELVTLVGQAGTGKTLLALAAGLELTVNQHRYEKLLVSRPVIPLGKDIGYLPGDKDDKLSLWMQPIFDNLTYLMGDGHQVVSGTESVRQKVDNLLKSKIVELEALSYIRGRSIPGQYIIVDEAQNLTPHEVKTIISRAGEGTKMVLTGDPDQIDNPYLDSSSNGLSYTVERLKGQPVHGHVTLTKSERSRLSGIAADFL